MAEDCRSKEEEYTDSNQPTHGGEYSGYLTNKKKTYDALDQAGDISPKKPVEKDDKK